MLRVFIVDLFPNFMVESNLIGSAFIDNPIILVKPGLENGNVYFCYKSQKKLCSL